MARSTKYSRELREDALRLVFEQVNEHDSRWEAICAMLGGTGQRCSDANRSRRR